MESGGHVVKEGWRVWSRRTEMASIMEEQQGVSQGRRARKVPHQGLSEEKSLSKSKERWRTLLTDIFWFRCLNLLLLFYLINYSESAPVGNTPRRVTEEKGSNVTLLCEFEARDFLKIILSRRSKNILVCQNDECKSENGRVSKKGACDVIIKDLIFSDAGKCILRVYYYNDQREVKLQTLEYQLDVHDEISVKTGVQVKLDILLSNAEKVEKNSSEGWKEVWKRGHGVSSDRLTDRDGNLIINNFTSTDAGTYRVLDYEENILITVTVTVTESKGNLNTTDKDKTDTEHHTVGYWIVAVVLTVIVIVTAVVLLKHLLRDHVQCVTRSTGGL